MKPPGNARSVSRARCPTPCDRSGALVCLADDLKRDPSALTQPARRRTDRSTARQSITALAVQVTVAKGR